jgi:hypothetical protein
MTNKREKGWKIEWLRTKKNSTSLAHRTVRCPRLARRQLDALENWWDDVAKIHRTVPWCTGLSGEPSAIAPKYIDDELVALGKRKKRCG